LPVKITQVRAFTCDVPLAQPIRVEWTDPAAEIDVSYKFQRRQPKIENGDALVSDDPGLGLDIDWEAVERYAA
jgi:L-alanine-DL-glutamate epimerase-like enolase superfamily enzyme